MTPLGIILIGGCAFWWQVGRLPKPEAFDEFLAVADGVRRVFLET